MEYWIATGVAAFFLGLSKGGVPAIALLSVPLMALFMDPAMAAGLLLPLYIVADVYAVYLFRRAFSVRNLKICTRTGFLQHTSAPNISSCYAVASAVMPGA